VWNCEQRLLFMHAGDNHPLSLADLYNNCKGPEHREETARWTENVAKQLRAVLDDRFKIDDSSIVVPASVTCWFLVAWSEETAAKAPKLIKRCFKQCGYLIGAPHSFRITP